MFRSSRLAGWVSAICLQYQCRQLSYIKSNCLRYLDVRNKYAKNLCYLQKPPEIFKREGFSQNLPSISVQKFHSGSEPPYLRIVEPIPATYPLVNIQVKGYDFSVLQGYQAWAAKVVQTMNLNVSDAWAAPCKNLEITRFEHKSAKVEDTFKLNIYERNVQVSELPSTALPVLLEVLQAGLPEGVDLYVDHHSEEADKARYVPNKELRELKQELAVLRDPNHPNRSKFKKKK